MLAIMDGGIKSPCTLRRLPIGMGGALGLAFPDLMTRWLKLSWGALRAGD